MRYSLFALIACVILSSGCGARLTKATAAKRSERLATERGKLPAMTDPVARTKSYIIISDILLSFASDAVQDGTIEELGVLMDQYVSTIRSARDTMVASKRNAERQPRGYRDLEIALRRHSRVLRDVGAQLLVDQRDPLDKAGVVVASTREELLQLLFPQQKPRAD